MATIKIHSFIDEEMRSDVLTALASVSVQTPITVDISSYGGSVFDAYAIFNKLKEYKDVTANISGIAASSASFIALGAGKVKMHAMSLFMIHNASSLSYGGSEQMSKEADLLQKLNAQIAQIYASKTGKPFNKIEEWMTAEKWFTAEEAKNEGFIDEIIPLNAKETPQDYLKSLVASFKPERKNKKTINEMPTLDIIALATAMGMPHNSGQNQILTRVSEIQSENSELKNQLEQALKRADDSEKKTKDFYADKAEAQLNLRLKSGQIKKEKKDFWKEQIAKDPENVLQIFEAFPINEKPKNTLKLSDVHNKKSDGEADKKSLAEKWDEYQTKDPAALAKIKSERPEEYKEMFNAKYKK